MKTITRFSIDYPVTVTMVVVGIVLLGVISFGKLGMDLFPDLTNPRIFIELTAGERPPEEIEQQFVKSVESLAIRQKKALDVTSVCRVGSATITVEYAWNTDMDEAYLDLQKALASVSQNSDIDDLTISQVDPNAAPIILIAFSHPSITDMDELRRTADSYLRNELIRLEGIADVRLLGTEEKEVVIDTDPYVLQAYGLTPANVASKIQDFNRNISGGSIVEMGQRYVVKGIGEFTTLDDISRVIVTYREPSTLTSGSLTTGRQSKIPVYLKDIATVAYANTEPDNMARFNGDRCIGIAVYKEMRYNTVNAVKDCLDAITRINRILPGYELTVVQNKGSFITRSIDEVKQSALIGMLLAVLVLFIFLRRIGATLIISVAIPISVVATFNLMYFNGLTLNIMTLGGLALGAGMLVDNAIVVVESIFSSIERGLPFREAVIEGASQVSGAITSSTITTIVVFLPIVYLQGAASELFRDQALTVAFSLLSSLLVAIFVIPMLAARFFKPRPGTKPSVGSVTFPRYGRMLASIIDHRWLVIIIAIALLAGGIALIPQVGTEFMPRTSENSYSIDISLPAGTSLERTDGVVRGLTTAIQEVMGDSTMVFAISGPSNEIEGESQATTEGPNTSTITVVPPYAGTRDPDAVIAALGAICNGIPDMEALIAQEQSVLGLTLGTSAAPLEIEVAGEDITVLQRLADEMAGKLASVPELYNITTSFERGRPEVNIVLDRERAGLFNIGTSTISSQLTTHLSGVAAGQWETEGELKNITLKLSEVGVEQLKFLPITGGTRTVYLYEIADITTVEAPGELHRRNQRRVGTVTAQLRGTMPFDQAIGLAQESIAGVAIPPEYKMAITGEEAKRREAFANLQFALILSIVLVYMVLASQFESLVHPFTIILSVPIAGVGAVLAFYALGLTLNIMAFIGIIMLAGIAVNDSIILVDAINQLKLDGLTRRDAIIEAGMRRVRPIIMTSITTVLALVPLALGIGEGGELRAPMAIAVIGGLITSTILTLAVIPCVFYVLDSAAERITGASGSAKKTSTF